jgi:hypothetical protein
MGMIRDINESLKQRINEETRAVNSLMEKIECVFESHQYSELFETATQFLSQVAEIIKTGKNLEPEQAKMIGAKLAALQLLADAGTRGSALSVIAGGDATKKISTIMKSTSGADQPNSQVDKVLVALAGKVGKSGADRNAQMFAGLDKMDEKSRATKSSEVASLVNSFKQLETKLQSSTSAPKMGGQPQPDAA